MKLQILVPTYKETEEEIRPLLSSISLQQGVNVKEDVGVIIVSDGGLVKFSEDFLKSFPFEIEYYIEEHKGVSATRNSALMKATAPYVSFSDADDMYYSMCGLWMVMKQIDIGFDTLVTKFVEETVDSDGNYRYIDHDNDHTFCHGKYFNRQFLLDNDLFWNPELTIHEDSFFNVQTWDLAEPSRRKYLSSSFYLWKYRKNSVCREDKNYIFKTYFKLIDSIDGIIDSYVSRGKMSLASGQVIHTLYRIYYMNYLSQWVDEDKSQYLEILNKRVSSFYKKYMDIWDSASEREKLSVSNTLRTEMIQKGMKQEKMTINQWFGYLLTL